METTKTILLALITLIALSTKPVKAQTQVGCTQTSSSVASDINIIAFGGYWMLQQNLYDHGNYVGMYADYLPYRSPRGEWTLGLYVTGNRSYFNDNLTKYQATDVEFGGGITSGYYEYSFTNTYQLFTGFSLGLKYKKDDGESNLRRGRYTGKQEDYILMTTLNINLMKSDGPKYIILPRTQVLISWQIPVASKKESTWRGQNTSSTIWNNNYYELMGKQSLLGWRVSSYYLCPKIIMAYSYSHGDDRSNYGFGGEISAHKPFEDDVLSIFFLYKCNEKFYKNVLTFGTNINFKKLF